MQLSRISGQAKPSCEVQRAATIVCLLRKRAAPWHRSRPLHAHTEEGDASVLQCKLTARSADPNAVKERARAQRRVETPFPGDRVSDTPSVILVV